jgi:acetyl-CoA decarbonylase/synthase complex subunit gamma
MIARITSELGFNDHLGACKARWGIGRMDYLVPPGLYAIGRPTPVSPVVVTANYKMSYDLVRQALAERDTWLLVLETFGINVWCAAGKGTFGTEELVKRIGLTGLAAIVSHRKLLLPILGAPGVSAHEVRHQTGFNVSFAAIRAEDLPDFLDNGQVTKPHMRELTFSFYERLVLIPVELVLALKSIFIIGMLSLAMAMLLGTPVAGLQIFIAWLGAAIFGIVIGPLLLPWLPGRSFAVKGAVVGLFWSGMFYVVANNGGWSSLVTGALFLSLPAISSFYTLNFTGCSPFTSRSGVKKEMRMALPVIGGALLLSLLLLLADKFL